MEIVYQQAQRWLKAGCFETLAEDLRVILRLAAGRGAQPTAVIIDSRTLRSTPEEIALLRVQGLSKREIGRRLGRSASTISRELRRNAATRSGGLEYRASAAQWHADRSGKSTLASNE